MHSQRSNSNTQHSQTLRYIHTNFHNSHQTLHTLIALQKLTQDSQLTHNTHHTCPCITHTLMHRHSHHIHIHAQAACLPPTGVLKLLECLQWCEGLCPSPTAPASCPGRLCMCVCVHWVLGLRVWAKVGASYVLSCAQHPLAQICIAGAQPPGASGQPLRSSTWFLSPSLWLHPSGRSDPLFLTPMPAVCQRVWGVPMVSTLRQMSPDPHSGVPPFRGLHPRGPCDGLGISGYSERQGGPSLLFWLQQPWRCGHSPWMGWEGGHAAAGGGMSPDF